MRRNARSITTSPDIVRHIDGLTEANFNLLTQLIEWLARHEKQHTKYRMAIINRLTRVEAAVSLILVGQEAQTQSKPPWYRPDKHGIQHRYRSVETSRHVAISPPRMGRISDEQMKTVEGVLSKV